MINDNDYPNTTALKDSAMSCLNTINSNPKWNSNIHPPVELYDGWMRRGVMIESSLRQTGAHVFSFNVVDRKSLSVDELLEAINKNISNGTNVTVANLEFDDHDDTMVMNLKFSVR